MKQIWLGMISDELEKSRMLGELKGVCKAIFVDFHRLGIPVECAGPQNCAIEDDHGDEAEEAIVLKIPVQPEDYGRAFWRVHDLWARQIRARRRPLDTKKIFMRLLVL